MPSHIFTRVGAWADSAATNRRAADVARKSNEPDQALHAMDYMTYAYLQLARDGDARKVFDEARTVDANLPAATGPYALAAMPARYVVERDAWGEAVWLTPVPSKYPYTEAMAHFARALGAARSGDPAAAQNDIARIAALRDQLKATKNEYWGNEVEVMRLASLAWAALAQKKGDDALALMRQAADIEDRSEKHIVTPGRLLPAREPHGDMLMELKRPGEALKEYEASQQREPNRYRNLSGAGQAAAQSGNRDKAQHYFSKLIELAGSGDLRPEMEAARRYLATN
jgi:tetratricopeptide (TPR) repeat protein